MPRKRGSKAGPSLPQTRYAKQDARRSPRTPFLQVLLARQHYAAGFKARTNGAFFGEKVNEGLRHRRGA